LAKKTNATGTASDIWSVGVVLAEWVFNV